MLKTIEAKQVSRAAATMLYPELGFAVKACGTYTREDFLDVLSLIAFEQEFANTGGKLQQLRNGETTGDQLSTRNSLAKSLLYHLRQLETDAIDTQFDDVRDRLLQTVRKQRLLPDLVDVAIDIHDWRFYGDKETERVLHTRPDQGTDRAFRFATLCIVAPEIRFTLAVVPLEANDSAAKRDAVSALVKEAREFIRIRHAYLDRGFYQVQVVDELEQLDVWYIVRARASSGMKALLPADEEIVVEDYLMQRHRPPRTSVAVTVFAVPHRNSDDEHVWFVTNLNVTDQTARAYAAAFRHRWGIETAYRQIGDFLPRTSSPTFSVRLFYFLFAVALYNLWVLANVLLANGTVPDSPPLSTKLFRLFIGPIEYG